MRNLSSWSLSLGRWGDVQVRLHALFLLFGVLALYLSTLGPGDGVPYYGAASILILLLSVGLHELGHCLAAFQLGGAASVVVIGPLGGLAPLTVPQGGRRDAVVALAGPAVNLSIFLFSGAVLLAAGQDFAGLLNPVLPRDLVSGGWPVVIIKLTCWLNWILFLVNLLPAFPMDGGPALRAWLTPMFQYRVAVLIVARSAKLTALGLLILAAVMHDALPSTSPVPIWVPLSLLAIFLFFSAQQEQQRLEEEQAEDDLLGYDFSQGYTSLERQVDVPQPAQPKGIRRWLDNRRRARLLRQQELEREEELRVDDILARLYSEGMQSLTAEERDLLHRVSARYRSRQNL